MPVPKVAGIHSAGTAPPYHRFNDFINTKNDRFDVLMSLFNELKLEVSVVNIAGKRHIFVASSPYMIKPGDKNKNMFTVLAAHYDRRADSPGANDNGAAVFMLIDAAMRLRGKAADNWLIIFTDKEELGQGESIKAQGAYSLAKGLAETGFGACKFFIFDACGRGDTLIISKTAGYLLKNEHGGKIAPLKNRLRLLQLRAMDAAKNCLGGRFLLLPTPFSDDAGFLRAGLAAQTITVLPAKEAAAFSALVRRNDLYINALISSEQQRRRGVEYIPLTWRLLNGPEDTAEHLDRNNFESVVQFAVELCRMNV
jgi:hypothetical protein